MPLLPKGLDRESPGWHQSVVNLQVAQKAVVEAARAAGAVMRKNLTAEKKANEITSHDIKLELDVRCQKLIEKNVATGGYLDGTGTPTPELLGEIEYVDASIGQMIDELKDRGEYQSTLIIVTAKHGQSPIDPKRYFPVPGPNNNNGTSPATLLAGANLIPFVQSPLNPTGIGPTEDDVSLLWLTDSSKTEEAVSILEAHPVHIGAGEIFFGSALAMIFNKPGLPPSGDPRTPDIIVAPNVGVTYTGSSAKLMEHGGFSHDDTNVMMLVSNAKLASGSVHAAVETNQVAPTILKELGLDPNSLDGVRLEGTAVLPGLGLQ